MAHHSILFDPNLHEHRISTSTSIQFIWTPSRSIRDSFSHIVRCICPIRTIRFYSCFTVLFERDTATFPHGESSLVHLGFPFLLIITEAFQVSIERL